MNIRLSRSAGWTAACVLALAGLSCDALNPALVGQLGGDASSASPAPTGNIVLIFNNQTTQALMLNYDTEISRPGEGTLTTTGSAMGIPAGCYWAATFDCNTTAIILSSITPYTTAGAGTPIELAVNEFRSPALQCGSVVFVNVPLLGSPTADLLP